MCGPGNFTERYRIAKSPDQHTACPKHPVTMRSRRIRALSAHRSYSLPPRRRRNHSAAQLQYGLVHLQPIGGHGPFAPSANLTLHEEIASLGGNLTGRKIGQPPRSFRMKSDARKHVTKHVRLQVEHRTFIPTRHRMLNAI